MSVEVIYTLSIGVHTIALIAVVVACFIVSGNHFDERADRIEKRINELQGKDKP